tara:strand:- start:1906 stop:2118 length:213 start_codon:yes stop_codon:yes gene_type:complete
MISGKLIQWWWRDPGPYSDPTKYTGIVLESTLVRTDREKAIVYKVLRSDGNIVKVREDSCREYDNFEYGK